VLTTLARHTDASGFGLLPTPNTGESLTGHGRRGGKAGNGRQSGNDLEAMARMGMLPTPDANCWKQGERGTGTGGGQQMSDAMFTTPTGSAGPMRLNPLFVSWMMGYPPGWLDVECPRSKPSATP
jgi:hypothetical protein